MSDTAPADARLDEELRTHVARAFGFDDPPETLPAFWERMLRTFAGALDREVTVADLCTTDHSPHRATVDGVTHHYQCATDAFILGAHLDEPVTARTVSPRSGTELVVEFDADGVVAAPDGAVLSFGVERSVEPPEGPVTPEAMYGRFCPYSEAFATREEYERWVEADPELVAQARPLDEALSTLTGILDGANGADGTDRPGGSSGEDCSC